MRWSAGPIPILLLCWIRDRKDVDYNIVCAASCLVYFWLSHDLLLFP